MCGEENASGLRTGLLMSSLQDEGDRGPGLGEEDQSP